ncbi:MAG: ATP-binding cassette domain-containing protein [Egibacteraceae bacterium]
MLSGYAPGPRQRKGRATGRARRLTGQLERITDIELLRRCLGFVECEQSAWNAWLQSLSIPVLDRGVQREGQRWNDMVRGIRTGISCRVFGETRSGDGIDLTVRAGTMYGVLGPNSAGKITTIRMLASLLRPDTVSAWWSGKASWPTPTRCGAA